MTVSTKTLNHQGFTLIELIITLSIAAILMAIAAPSFSGIIQNNRMTTQYNELLASLSLARSEAIKRTQRVTVCQSSTNNSCGGDSSSWHSGWIVFVDENADNTRDAGEDILRANSVLAGNNTLSYGARTRVGFDSDGLASGGSNGTFTLCDSRGDSNRQGLVISPTGRARPAVSGDNVVDCPS
ncbi:hypothetical protein A9Q78_01885 [Methylophaga sp. 41_12_T18]|nr:hypothetical protein A9Q78_01885 [Methylophaga sp. 41_12_T18]